MAKIGRIILAVLAGATVWAVLWNLGTLGTQAALPDIVRPEQPLTHAGVLLAFIGYSVGLSVLAGFITALVGGKTPMPAVWSLAVLQLSIGIAVEVSYWNLMPVWYHLAFLALIVPATVYGGKVRTKRSGAPVAAASY